MTIHVSYRMTCTQCGKELNDHGETNYESEADMMKSAKDCRWSPAVFVSNGSKWDFCGSCFESYDEDQKI